MENQSKIFVSGMSFKRPREGAPEFVKGQISINVKSFIDWFKQHANGKEWLNIDLKSSKEGKLYLELNTFKPQEKQDSFDITQAEEKEIQISDIPF
jgi:hypothetical protein